MSKPDQIPCGLEIPAASAARQDNQMVPGSPTDHILSPTSKHLLDQRRKHRLSARGSLLLSNVFNVSEQLLPGQFSLEAEVQPIEKPTSLPLVLGSSSPSRRKIMEALHWPFEVMIPDIDEKAIRCDDHMQLPLIIAKAKADAIWERLLASAAANPSDNPQKPFILITSDQIVYFNGEVREKPTSAREAEFFLSSYSGRAVSTISALVATHWPSGRQAHEVDVATVFWKDISPEVIQRVIGRGDIYASAGGFRIEDEDLNPLILDIEGGVDSVLGLPVDPLVRIIDVVMDEEETRSSGLFFGEMSSRVD